MPPKTDPSAVVIPFGKHKGATVAELLATDPQYADWLLAQGWLAERFAELHSAIQTRGAGADDTPEHNTIQGRFLDPLFCAAFVCLTQDVDTAKAEDRESRTWLPKEEVQSVRGKLDWARKSLATALKYASEPDDAPHRKLYGADYWLKDVEKCRSNIREHEDALAEAENRLAAIQPLPLSAQVVFEQRGVDVVMHWGFHEPGRGQPREISIEIKPSMGEDYPTVMRQMQRLRARYLVVDNYTGKALPFETVRSMFEANGRTVVTVREIEAEIPNARALL